MPVPTPTKISQSARKQGFTLVELLLVIAVILILASITFGISRGVQNAQARAKAKAEMATISQALGQFKSRYGDYPWHQDRNADNTENNKLMLYALTGRLVLADPFPNVAPDEIKAIEVTDEDEIEKNPKFLDDTKFSTTIVDDETESLLDPWGNPYYYLYKNDDNPDDWEVFGFHLYSTGPKGLNANRKIKPKINIRTGIIDSDFREIANEQGIIFANE